MAPNKGQSLAQHLAAHVERKCFDSWNEGPQVALLPREHDNVESVVLRSISEPADVSIAGLQREPAAAACMTALGHAAPSGAGVPLRRRVRVTVAVTCCSASSIVRSFDGGVARSDEAEGPLVDALRSLAGLGCCSCSAIVA